MTKPKLIYLHGFASSPASQKARFFRERFAGLGIELHVPNLDEGDFEHLTISRQLNVVERLAAGEPVSLIGSSMGGYLAALYASRHPETRKLVLLAPAFGFARRWPATLGEEQLEQWKRTGYIEIYHYTESRNCKLGYGLLEDGARHTDCPRFPQPALIFHGSRDNVVPPEVSAEFAKGQPNVRLEIVDSDHELKDVLELLWKQTSAFLDLSGSAD